MKPLLFLPLLALVTACYHPLEIVGQGSIVSSVGHHDCLAPEQACDNLVTGDYNVTYTAVPRAGWAFVRWEGCGAQHPDCTFATPASVVSQFAGSTAPTLRAIFEPINLQSNILLIIADDMAFDDYGFAGHPQLQTPSIDVLAAASVRFPQAYVSSTCRPSLATLLTGLPEHRHGVTSTTGPQLGVFPTIAGRLGSAGYASYQSGKFWEGDPQARGFTDFTPFNRLVGNDSVGRTSMQPIYDFIAQATTPWFVWFSPTMPHAPHDAPSQYTDQYQGLGLDDATIEYFGMISWFDDAVGELLQQVATNTVVIFLADNGYVQSTTPETPGPKSKASSYERGIRTQLLIRDSATAAIERLELVNEVDVPATILAIASAYHDDLPGRDLMGPPPLASSAYGSRSTQGFYGPPGILLERWIRVGDWKLVDVQDGQDRLNNLPSDPNESVNEVNAPEYAQLLLDLQNELETWWLQ